MNWESFITTYHWIIAYGPGILWHLFVIGLWLIRLFNKWLKNIFERKLLILRSLFFTKSYCYFFPGHY